MNDTLMLSVHWSRTCTFNWYNRTYVLSIYPLPTRGRAHWCAGPDCSGSSVSIRILRFSLHMLSLQEQALPARREKRVQNIRFSIAETHTEKGLSTTTIQQTTVANPHCWPFCHKFPLIRWAFYYATENETETANDAATRTWTWTWTWNWTWSHVGGAWSPAQMWHKMPQRATRRFRFYGQSWAPFGSPH